MKYGDRIELEILSQYLLITVLLLIVLCGVTPAIAVAFDRKRRSVQVRRQSEAKSTVGEASIPSIVMEREIVRERGIVKVRCPCCGQCYDEVKGKCPNCGGR